MAISVFAYQDYKHFLRDLIETYPGGGRGLRKQLADAIRCQIAYVTHVLSGTSHFSPEQAEAASRFFGLSTEESEYFVLLVARNRASTRELESFYDRMLADRADKNRLLKSRLRIKETLGREDQATYYSHWAYAAVHMALTVPGLRTREALARKLKIPLKQVASILEFLCSRGLARLEGGSYSTTNLVLHLERDSPMISRHHTNWRIAAMNSFNEEQQQDLHYSSVVTCSRADLAKVREKLSRCLKECIDLIRDSKEEEVAALCIDLFEL